MKLSELTATVDGAVEPAAADGDGSVDISGLAYDSRAVEEGALFFCVSGFRIDGHDFAPQAIEQGAVALVTERPLGLGVPEVHVASARAAMAPMAARFYGCPSRELAVVGVTGTNGKTTSAYLIRALLEASGRQCGLLGTVKSVIGGEDRPVNRTTPEAIDLQADLRAMLDGGDQACAIEVSSHALELGRADAIGFAGALFTNLTQDHLDFHPTMEDYFQAKRRLFLPPAGPAPAVNVINTGDPYGRRLAQDLGSAALTFAVDGQADYSATELECSFDGCRFLLRTPAGDHRLSLPMPGRFNVANALGALVVTHALGCPLETLLHALERGVRVPGRFEPVDEGQDFAVLVDYAHTPDSLQNVLRSAVELLEGDARLICVFGAGGDRDRGKRLLMGRAAVELADEVIVTSDNPRSEDPEAIITEIFTGIHGTDSLRGGYTANGITDRREAIAFALSDARQGDIVVIAGKGHEQGQEFEGGRKVPFDDVTVAGEMLRAHRRAKSWAG
jgi:UDP-N-acetylmuramoyl-L-alanyl-D-glutamate--2,6-diaminopimelate ligase